MRDHREPIDQDTLAELRRVLDMGRPKRDITRPMRANSAKFQPTPDRDRRRKARKQARASRKANRR